MKETKTAEEALGETYAAPLGSIKDFIISAIDVYAEQARREERGKIKSEMENLKFTAEDMALFADWYSMNWDLDFKPDAALEQWLEERRKSSK